MDQLRRGGYGIRQSFPSHGEEEFFKKVKKTWAGNHIIHGVPDMESTLDYDIDLEKLNGIIAEFKGQPDSLIEVLHQVQEAFGYIPEAIQAEVAKGLDVPLSQVYGVVTFYNLFTMVPRGKHTISVCLGTSCYVRGGKRIMEKLKESLKIEDGGTTEDRMFSLESIRCMGACALAPVVKVDNDLYSHVVRTKLPEILSKYE